MLPREVLRQIRRLQLRARRAVEDLLGGEYHSVFKGTGMAFEEVREYQPGDDVRTIDWNVTARMGHPFIKRYIEERELTVLILVDWSGSHQFGTARQQKREVAAELAAVLAFSAISNNDKVGLIGFTDRVECFLPPRKGVRHVLRLIREALYFQPVHRGTSLREGLNFLNRIQHRRAIVFLLSDFLDRKVSQEYGIYIPKYGIANRVTFVIDTDGKIDTIESGGDAIKMLKTPDACSRLAHRKPNGS